ncbi:cupin domain-containing protein [Serratia ficaria]|uniref:cupin domain-containing protein n=1 Tax=Serratia ficaria TaxID=61651 RepID=UPI000BA2E9A9|nr:cupin domain-containing protein [Serratia ficaria]REF42003.1 mannose-6-phosphate isomerase-like protein (cupin superfamily) [Serratia ficaria]
MSARILKPGEGQLTGVAGDIYTIKTSGSETGGAYSVMEAIIPAQKGPPPHRHSREEESFFVLEGELEFFADGVRSVGGVGTWVTLPRGSLHYFKNIGTTPAKMLILAVPAGLEDYFIEVSQPAGTFSEENPPEMDDKQIEKMIRLGPKYGIEIVPPHD